VFIVSKNTQFSTLFSCSKTSLPKHNVQYTLCLTSKQQRSLLVKLSS